MTVDEFRSLALSFPEAVESAHQDHPDFRVRGKIFATLGPLGNGQAAAGGAGGVCPHIAGGLRAIRGCVGRQGCTRVTLAEADEASVRQALAVAWGNAAPKRLAHSYDREQGGCSTNRAS